MTMNARLLAVGGSVMDLGFRHHPQSFPGPTLQSFSQVLSSAENIAVGLAIEKACTWLSANITGKAQARGVAGPSFSEVDWQEVGGHLGETGLRACWEQRRAWVGKHGGSGDTFSVLPLTGSTDQERGESSSESRASSPGSGTGCPGGPEGLLPCL